MKFNDNLKSILKVLNCTNVELANAAKLDPTVTSRFKNGSRVPTEGSLTYKSLVSGLTHITIEKRLEKEIINLCGKKNSIEESISSYLVSNSSDIRLNKDDNTLIGANLDLIMNTLNTSNVMIAKHLNKDASLISKYKKEKRYIIRNDSLVEELCKYFSWYATKNNLEKELINLLKVNNYDDINNDILSFLFTKYETSNPISNFLENLSNYKLNNLFIPSVKLLVSSELLNDQNTTYIGEDGLRNSVKKFLGNVCLNTSRELYLYSDESMDWMTSDEKFFNTWKSLMINALMKKNKIKIIHNINRNINEMFKAIDSWLPLYMTGLIEPYYNTRRSDNLFNHTLFIADDLAVINSFSVTNSGENTFYNYSEDKFIVEESKNQFLTLLNTAKPLVKIYVRDGLVEKLKANDLYDIYNINNLNNLIIKIKKDDSELLIERTDNQPIIFEFNHPNLINVIKSYVVKK